MISCRTIARASKFNVPSEDKLTKERSELGDPAGAIDMSSYGELQQASIPHRPYDLACMRMDCRS
jgi:hypothetical protein